MIHAIIEASVRNKFMVLLLTGALVAAGVVALATIPLDAIPDLSDVQVIIFTSYPGQAPQVVEDQVTYPLTTKMLAVPFSKVVRGYSFFGFSFVYVIFEDGTDLYWARSRVLEYLSGIQSSLPPTAKVELGPLGGGTSTLSFDAGASADLLVVALSSEKSGGTYAVAYNGVGLTEAVLGGTADIWYLDLGATGYTGGAADLVVDYTGLATVNGVGIGVVSVSAGGQPITLHATGAGASASDIWPRCSANTGQQIAASFSSYCLCDARTRSR